MLTDFNETLKNVLVQRMPLDPNEVDVSFECPKREWSAKILKPTINLYLFDLRENVELRHATWMTERGPEGPSGLRRPLVNVDLSYFVTAWARTVIDEHQLLWRVMATLMRESTYSSELLVGEVQRAGPPVKTLTAHADGVVRNPGEFWGALDNDLKPAVTYTATLALDLDVLEPAPLVLTKVIDLGGMPELPGPVPQRLTAIGGTVCTRPDEDNRLYAVPDAWVTFPDLGISVRSDRFGRYTVAQIPEGQHRVRVVSPEGRASDSEVQVRALRPAPRVAEAPAARPLPGNELSDLNELYDLEV